MSDSGVLVYLHEDRPELIDEETTSFSWTIESDIIALKKTDRSVFLHHGTVIPQRIRHFFEINDLRRGEKRMIVLWDRNNAYNAFIEMTIHESPRTRMMWKSNFASLLHTEYPNWYTFFKAGNLESDDTPSIKFIKKREPYHYVVKFLDSPSSEAPIDFQIPIKPGETIDNERLRTIFKCSSQGGMRRSLKTNSLVLVSDHTKGIYEDKWDKNIFHYTGMGLTGNQSLSFHQNKTLAESRKNGVHLHLFEVFEEGKYVYIGEVELADSPYIDKQPDIDKNIRDVYIFPLKVKGGEQPPLVNIELIERKDEVIQKKTHKLSLEELELRAKYSHETISKREVVSDVYERYPAVAEYVKRIATGICQLCNQPAPFNKPDGEPFLETHHIEWLSQGGKDVIENTVALCPNCHRKMHVLNRQDDVAILKEKASQKR